MGAFLLGETMASSTIARLNQENKQLRRNLISLVESLYGQDMEVTNFHLNGDLEPIDNFFEDIVDFELIGVKMKCSFPNCGCPSSRLCYAGEANSAASAILCKDV